jgi:hypothetical protein
MHDRELIATVLLCLAVAVAIGWLMALTNGG